MSTHTPLLEQILAYLHAHSASSVTSAWIEHQLETEPPSVPPTANFIPFTQEVIYRRWLSANWMENNERFRREWSRPVLPPELNLSLMNSRKMTFEGRFLLQINDITDISRALVYDEMPEDDLYDYDDFVELPDPPEEDEDPTIAELLTKNDNTRGGKRGRGRGRGRGKKAAPPPPPPKKKNPPGPPPAPKPAPWESGKRMFQLELTDGHSTTLAIEYETIGVLRANLAGAKILLIGPFDVYMGTILLRPSNLELLTDGIPLDSTPRPPPPPPPPTVAPLAQSVTTTNEPCGPPTPPPTPIMLIREPLSDLQFTNIIMMDDDYNDSTILDSVLDHNNNISTNMDIDKDEAVVSSSSDAVKVIRSSTDCSQNVEEDVTGSGQMDDEMEKYFDGLQDEDLGEQFFV